MSRRRCSSMIRRAGSDWFIKTEGELKSATCYLKSDNKVLWCNDAVLETGNILCPASSPLRLFLITEARDSKLYNEYEVSRISNHAQLLRFSQDAVRDSFGRVVEILPTWVYSDLPLVLLPSVKSSDDSQPDRSAETDRYVFMTSDRYLVKPKDRLTVDGLNLIVEAVHVSPDGLLRFSAVSAV